jgi:hypothetical protein
LSQYFVVVLAQEYGKIPGVIGFKYLFPPLQSWTMTMLITGMPTFEGKLTGKLRLKECISGMEGDQEDV